MLYYRSFFLFCFFYQQNSINKQDSNSWFLNIVGADIFDQYWDWKQKRMSGGNGTQTKKCWLFFTFLILKLCHYPTGEGKKVCQTSTLTIHFIIALQSEESISTNKVSFQTQFERQHK